MLRNILPSYKTIILNTYTLMESTVISILFQKQFILQAFIKIYKNSAQSGILENIYSFLTVSQFYLCSLFKNL